MAVDWLGFGYAAIILFGGFMGYKRKGSLTSLIAGLLFGGISAYGAFRISVDPQDKWTSFAVSGALAVVMGIRFKKSGKLMPAGIVAGLRLLTYMIATVLYQSSFCADFSLVMVVRLLLL